MTEWLCLEALAELTRSRCDISVGHSHATARTAIESGEVRSKPFEAYYISGGVRTHSSIARLFNEADYLDWLKRHPPAEKPMPPPRPPLPTPLASQKQIDKIVVDYHRSLQHGENPSRAGLEQFAQEQSLTGHRDQLREADKRLFGQRPVGRPSKK